MLMAGLSRRPIRPATAIQWLALACLLISSLLGGCADIPANKGASAPPFAPSDAGHPPVAIGVLTASWHSGIVLPTGELGPLKSLLNEPQATYLNFGWGNRRFYMSTHPGLGDAVAALFGSPSALFVQAVSAPADLLAPDVRIHWICADRDELRRVKTYIEESLSRSGGKPVDLGNGPLPGSRFYASIGHYSSVHTCNTWTVAALQYAGLPVRAGGVIFASQVASRLRALRACPAP